MHENADATPLEVKWRAGSSDIANLISISPYGQYVVAGHLVKCHKLIGVFQVI